MSDAKKVEAVRSVFDAGVWATKKANSGRGWSTTAQRDLERKLRRSLTTLLGRPPTDEEIGKAGGDD